MNWDQAIFIPVLAESLQTSTNPSILQYLGIVLGLLGLFFFVGTAVGMIRFPDFYTRMHAAGKGDTLSTMLMLSGFGLVSMEDLSVGSWLLFLKIMGVVLFIFIRQVGIFVSFQITHRTIFGCFQIHGEASN